MFLSWDSVSKFFFMRFCSFFCLFFWCFFLFDGLMCCIRIYNLFISVKFCNKNFIASLMFFFLFLYCDFLFGNNFLFIWFKYVFKNNLCIGCCISRVIFIKFINTFFAFFFFSFTYVVLIVISRYNCGSMFFVCCINLYNFMYDCLCWDLFLKNCCRCINLLFVVMYSL